MKKEIIICIIIVIAILWGNQITQNYTKESVNKLITPLMKVREEISYKITEQMEKQGELEQIKQHVDEIYAEWEVRHDKLAYYIEHDELEKVETQLTGIKSDIETMEKEEAINEIDKSAFLLKHIEDKYAFNLQNVF